MKPMNLLIVVGSLSAMSPAQAVLENPGTGAVVSGIQTISGWWCNADQITIEFDGVLSAQAAYGTERADTAGACGDSNNGFGLLFNWNLLGAGQHTVRAFADGVQFAEHVVHVGVIGAEQFASGLSGQCLVQNFPSLGTNTRLVWSESLQNFVVSGTESGFGVGTPCETEIAEVLAQRGQPDDVLTIEWQGLTESVLLYGTPQTGDLFAFGFGAGFGNACETELTNLSGF